MSKFLLAASLLLCPWLALAETPIVGHDIRARVEPPTGTLQVTDRITLPEGSDDWTLVLHSGLSPRVLEPGATLERIGREGHLERYRLRRSASGPVTLEYGGEIRHAMESLAEGMGRARQSTLGTIGPEGVFLDGSSGWYPRVEGSLQRFDLRVELPEDWVAVSQGAGPGQESADAGAYRWSEQHPQDDIYLIAAPFHLYRADAGGFDAQVYLRSPDDALAERYLKATEDYVALYDRLIGPYPYAKFALVENFWETGYGMPSFTLLGPRVLRLPFIIDTSYPHEVLHNWWGNGVYVDYASGNWSEGLTAYLADHLMKERAGSGAEYRRDTLKAYADYVRDGEDFPLTAFRGRHGSASQAIGYGKTAMFFHMLRRQLGDQVFRQGLQRFYADNRFRAASYDDIRRAFETVSESDLRGFFDAWTTRAGAPSLALTDVQVEPAPGGFQVTGQVDQTQSDRPFPLRVPVVIHQESGPPQVSEVTLDGRTGRFATHVASRPVRVAADPSFDLFRALAPGETPVTLSSLFGAETGVIVLPAGEPADRVNAYRQLAEAWRRGNDGWEIRRDDELEQVPTDRPVWLLGWDNRLATTVLDGAPGVTLTDDGLDLTGPAKPVTRSGDSVVLTRLIGGQPLGWVASASPEAIAGLARKLPHYGKYSYLVFTGSAPDIRDKGQWPVSDSPLMVWLTDQRPALQDPPEAPLDAEIREP